MTPNQMQDHADAMRDLYARAEETMLRKMARRVTNGFSPTNVNGWAERKYREVDRMRRELAEEVRSLNDQSAMMREAMLNEAYESGMDSFEQELISLGRVQQVIPKSRYNAVSSLVSEMDRKFDALHSQILRTTEDEYRHIIGSAVSLQATGVTTTHESIKKALEDFADKGITSFTDRAGRNWNMDTYAEMAVRTGMMRAAVQGYTDDALDHDEHLVIVSDHQDTCPICEKWERRVLALDELGRRQPDCEGTLDEAEAAGLFHPNCLHSVTVYVPGLTIKAGSKARQGYTRQMNAEGYANRQNQRYMERMVRRWKRRQAVATTPEDERLAKAYVDKWQQKLRDLTDDTDLPRLYRREGGRQKLSEAAKKLKPLKIADDGGIIDPNTPPHNSKFRWQKQNEHINGTPEFSRRVMRAAASGKPLPSVFYEDVDVESLVTPEIDKHLTYHTKNGDSQYFSAGKPIGRAYSKEKGYVETERVCIRFSKDGWHAYPVEQRK